MKILEVLGWPVAEEDITLLEQEIEAGVAFLQQASDLQQEARRLGTKKVGKE